jgi:hypothetical protein
MMACGGSVGASKVLEQRLSRPIGGDHVTAAQQAALATTLVLQRGGLSPLPLMRHP